MRYILIDTMHLFFRMRHTANKQATIDDKLGMCLHSMLASANKVVTMMQVDHVVFALEGHSWRKDFYEPYKKQREVARMAKTEAEAEEDALFFETYNKFLEYIINKTNCTVIKSENAEGDDCIARFIHIHPNDEHIILSSDSDFHQLITKKVSQYNGMTKEFITNDGYFNDNNKPIIDKKTKEHKILSDPKWLLFEKCMRGDKADNVFSAYPGVRTKGTKNKVGLLEAFNDRNKKGYSWNNIMLSKWVDHNNKEHRVLDDYERNVKLIDLTAQPDEIKEEVDIAIINSLLIGMVKCSLPNKIGFDFMKFCGSNELIQLSKYSDNIVKWLSKTYKGELLDGEN